MLDCSTHGGTGDMDLSKVRVEAETAYGSDNPLEMVVQYLQGTLQAHWVLDGFMWTQFCHYPEVDLHITLYLFEYKYHRVEVLA